MHTQSGWHVHMRTEHSSQKARPIIKGIWSPAGSVDSAFHIDERFVALASTNLHQHKHKTAKPKRPHSDTKLQEPHKTSSSIPMRHPVSKARNYSGSEGKQSRNFCRPCLPKCKQSSTCTRILSPTCGRPRISCVKYPVANAIWGKNLVWVLSSNKLNRWNRDNAFYGLCKKWNYKQPLQQSWIHV